MKPGRLGTVAWGPWAAICALSPMPAQAHSGVAGMGAIVNGLLHPLMTPAHLLLILAMGLWVGQQRPLSMRWPLLTLLGFAAAGLAGSSRFPLPASWQPAVFLLALVAALHVATVSRFQPAFGLPLAGASGLLIGLDSGVEPATMNIGTTSTLVATWLSIGICLVDLAYFTAIKPQSRWLQTGIRVLAAWIAAVCVLLLALALRTRSAG